MSKYSDKVKARIAAAQALAINAGKKARFAIEDGRASPETARVQRDGLASQASQMAEKLRDLTKTLDTLTRKFDHRKTAASCERQHKQFRVYMATIAKLKAEIAARDGSFNNADGDECTGYLNTSHEDGQNGDACLNDDDVSVCE